MALKDKVYVNAVNTSRNINIPALNETDVPLARKQFVVIAKMNCREAERGKAYGLIFCGCNIH